MVPKLSEMIRTDEERSVVMACLEAYAELLRETGPAVLQAPGHLEAIVNCVKEVMTKKVSCFKVIFKVFSENYTIFCIVI